MENKILTTNFHTHTTRCNHAVGEDRQYVEAAIKVGLKALAILHANGEPEAYRLGVIAEGEGVELC